MILKTFVYSYFSVCVCMCVCVCVCVRARARVHTPMELTHHACAHAQMITGRMLTSTVWILGIKLRLPGFAASSLTCLAISVAQSSKLQIGQWLKLLVSRLERWLSS